MGQRAIQAGTAGKSLTERVLWYAVRDRNLYLMLLPAFAIFLIFRYVPIFNGLIIPFVDYDLVGGQWASPWVGFKWFRQFFEDPFFWRIIRNTLWLGILSLVFGFPAPIILALLFNELRSAAFKRVAQTISYLPHFIATVVIVGIIYNFFGFQGIVNTLLQFVGIEPIKFMNDSGWFRPLYVGSGVWQGMGWGAIVYLAALAGVNAELYESAVIDGASRWHQMLFITLPSILPVIQIVLIFAVADIVDVSFEKVFLMYHPGIYETADVIQTYVYRRGIVGLDFSYGQAIGLFNGAIALILLVSANYISRKTSESSLW